MKEYELSNLINKKKEYKLTNIINHKIIGGFEPVEEEIFLKTTDEMMDDITHDIYRDFEKEKEIECRSENTDVYFQAKSEREYIESLGSLFKETQVDKILTTENEKPIEINQVEKKGLLSKLNKFDPIINENENMTLSRNLSIRTLITSRDDEEDLGRKIIRWVFANLIQPNKGKTLFQDLKMVIFGGYVYFARKGIQVSDIITPESIPNLKFFKWSYGIPIDYDTLKFVLFQNSYQQKVNTSNEQLQEAELILSQEYLVSLQPEPSYLMSTLKRLIELWYADPILNANIRKIKVLVNQYRSRNSEIFNIKNGILPSIVVFPKYGSKSARLVISKISYYFSLYKTLGWSCSNPSYFVKLDNLIYYTNGAVDLKIYYRNSMSRYDDREVKQDSFTDTYDKFYESKDIIN
jgi:hypothetical protein